MIWDGAELRCYINDDLVIVKSSVSWKETQLFIGGWQIDPHSASGVAWGNTNGIYRNLVFTE